MGVLIIIIVLVVLWAHKSGRPMKLLLTPEEAKAVKAKWWFRARNEVKVWAICFVLGYALVGQSLASAHWHWPIYAMIVLGSLQLFSRLAIWGTFALWAVTWAVASTAELLHHQLCNPLYIMVPLMGAIIAILARFIWRCCKPTKESPVKKISPFEGIFAAQDFDDRVYDYETDTYLYKEGNRQNAYIRYPRDEDRPENRRKRAQYDDYSDGLR
jgi:hypothetical protein